MCPGGNCFINTNTFPPSQKDCSTTDIRPTALVWPVPSPHSGWPSHPGCVTRIVPHSVQGGRLVQLCCHRRRSRNWRIPDRTRGPVSSDSCAVGLRRGSRSRPVRHTSSRRGLRHRARRLRHTPAVEQSRARPYYFNGQCSPYLFMASPTTARRTQSLNLDCTR